MFFIPDQVAAPSHNKHAKKQSFVLDRLVNKGKLPPTIQNELRTIPNPRHKQFLEHVQIWASMMTVILPNLILKIASYNNCFDEMICPSIEVLFFHVYYPILLFTQNVFCFFPNACRISQFSTDRRNRARKEFFTSTRGLPSFHCAKMSHACGAGASCLWDSPVCL